MEALTLFANIATAPFRMLYSLFQTVVMTLVVLILLVVAPFNSLLTMPGYQRQANEVIPEPDRDHVLIDFSTNTVIEIPATAPGQAVITQIPTDSDYKSFNASTLGQVPAMWGFWNVVGFYSDSEEWMEGKQAPMYAAYAEAATTTDALRACITTLITALGDPKAHIVLPDAPKIGMEYAYHPASYILSDTPLVIFGLCPVNNCDAADDFHFREARDFITPSVSAGQAEAIAQMKNTMTDEYWLRAAHANGLYDTDDAVKFAAKYNRDMLKIRFDYDPSNVRFWVFMELGYLFLVLSIIGCFCVSTCVSIYRWIFC